MTLGQDHSVKDPINPQAININKGAIEFNDVSFKYDDSNSLFKNFNIVIARGQKVGLVGPSGGGKSTITKLLLRLMDIQKGQISIDGQDISQIRQDELREHIAYVPQEPILFHRSLKENIAYGNPSASDEDIIKASKSSHADEFIKDLKDGYDTLVGERGVKLSGGQRQRIAIARAMLKTKSPILLLDEATSALDSENEKLIQDGLWRLMQNRTVIVIAHRLSTIQHMDRILVIDKGSVIEDGRHQELILKKDGVYAKLWQRQSGGFILNK
jgi:ATP-binding cassette subfamily B protein